MAFRLAACSSKILIAYSRNSTVVKTPLFNFSRNISISRPCFTDNDYNVGLSRLNEANNLISDALPGASQFGIIADSPITRLAEGFLINLHDMSGMEWTSTIFLAALLFRLSICFPIRVYQERLMAKLLNVQSYVDDVIKKRFPVKAGDSIFAQAKAKENALKHGRNIRDEIYKKEGCLPYNIPLSSFLQLPFWIYLSTSIRNLTFGKFDHTLPMEQIEATSFLWVESISNIDPYYILPGIYFTFAFANIKYSSLNSLAIANIQKIFSIRKYLTLTCICVITLLISKMPASVGLFWIFSNMLHFTEVLVLDSIFVKRLFNVPKTAIEPKNIYAEKYYMLTQKTAANLKRIKSLIK